MAADRSVGFYSSQGCRAEMADNIHAAAKNMQTFMYLRLQTCKWLFQVQNWQLNYLQVVDWHLMHEIAWKCGDT